jgi:hypothetical protein
LFVAGPWHRFWFHRGENSTDITVNVIVDTLEGACRIALADARCPPGNVVWRRGGLAELGVDMYGLRATPARLSLTYLDGEA